MPVRFRGKGVHILMPTMDHIAKKVGVSKGTVSKALNGAPDISDALHALADVRTLDELAAQLDDPAQRDALESLQRARWGGGDAASAREQLRRAFARGVKWRNVRATDGPLPPLYPPA